MVGEHDRYGTGGLPGDSVEEGAKIRSTFRRTRSSARTRRRSTVDIFALDITMLAQACSQRTHTIRRLGRGTVVQISDLTNLRRLLSIGNERSNENTPAHDGHERSTVHHSMTWSARSSSEGGIVTPSAFEVLRLMTSSNLVGCWTGRSLGFAPLRILSTYVADRLNRSRKSGP